MHLSSRGVKVKFWEKLKRKRTCLINGVPLVWVVQIGLDCIRRHGHRLKVGEEGKKQQRNSTEVGINVMEGGARVRMVLHSPAD